MPEEFFGNLKKKILPQWTVCFWSAVLFGLLAHFYKITNWLPNWDSLVFRYDPQDMLGMGRWFLSVASAFSSHFDLPFFTGLLAILLHSVGAVLICCIFRVKKNTTALLIGGAVATFPTVTSVMTYNYVADAYAFSFVLAVLSAYFFTCEKPRFILAAILLAFSVGTYQAYLTVTVMLLLCHLIRETLRKESTPKELLVKSGKFLLTGFCGMLLYYGILLLLLKIRGMELLEYQGLNDAASFSAMDIFASLYVIKEAILTYFVDFSQGLNAFSIINLFVFLLTAVFYLSEIIRGKLGWGKLFLLAVFILALPFGACILAFINSRIDYHNLMKMGFFVFYLFFFLQYEKEEKSEKQRGVKAWSILLVSTVLILTQALLANISYHKLGLSYEKSYGTLIRIADRLEQTEGAENCGKILVLGALDGSEAYSALLPPNLTGITDGYILRADDEIVGQSVLCSALNDYCGTDYQFLAGKEKKAILEKIEGKSLGVWPEANCILVQDDVLIIKMGEVEEKK